MHLRTALLLVVSAICSLSVQAQRQKKQIVRIAAYFSEYDLRPAYDLTILRKALAVTESQYGQAEVITVDGTDNAVGQNMLFHETDGWTKVDVTVAMATDSRSNYAIPIDIDVSLGMIGQRVLVIEEKSQSDFAAVHTLDDLKKIALCVGADWPDYSILKNAGLNVVPVERYQETFASLSAGKCKGVSRAIYEAADEIKSFPLLHLAVEQTLLIKFPARNIFYVSKSQTELAQRINAGLMTLQKNGVLKATAAGFLEKAVQTLSGRRKVFSIQNPLDRLSMTLTPQSLSTSTSEPTKATLTENREKAAVEVVRHLSSEARRDRRLLYLTELLDLAIKKSQSEFGPAKLVDVRDANTVLSQKRAFKELGKKLDVVSSMETIERNKTFRKVSVTIDRGLLGARVALVREDRLPEFLKIKSLPELRAFSVGLGHDWPDVDIMRENGFEVVTGADYHGLFMMLESKRFDFFSRGVLEFVQELKVHAQRKITWASNFMLVYPAPLRFYVARDDESLQKRLELGLRIAERDGDMQRVFYKYFGDVFEQLKNFPQPIVFKLKNSDVDDSAPYPDLSGIFGRQETR